MSKLYSIENLQEIIESPSAELAADITDIAQQLLDIMRENERLREILTKIKEKATPTNLSFMESEIYAAMVCINDILDEIASCKQSLRKEFAQTSIDMFKPQGTPILDSLMGKPKSSDITDK